MTMPVRTRNMTAALLVWVPAVVVAVTWALTPLPERIATHWSGFGAPDGFTRAVPLSIWLLGLAVGAGVAAVAAATLIRRPGETPAPDASGPVPHRAGQAPHRAGQASGDVGALPGVPAAAPGGAGWPAATRWVLTAAGTAGGGAAGVWLVTVTATLAAPTPETATLGWRFVLLLAGLAWGAVIWAAAGPQPATTAPLLPPINPLALSATERAAFSTTLRSPLIIVTSLVAAVTIAAAAATTQGGLWPVLVVPLLTGVLLGRVRLTVDRRGVRLLAGLFGIPVKRIPLTAITAATATEIDPLAWGGWGYRIKPGRSALVLRRGPGMVLNLRNGHQFAVTLDSPQTPAALVAALLARPST